MKPRLSRRLAIFVGVFALLAGAAAWLLRDQKAIPSSAPASTQSATPFAATHDALPTQAPVVLSPAQQRTFADFGQWLHAFNAAAPATRAALLEEGRRLARERRPLMEQMIERDPREALRHAVTLDVWRGLPPELQAQVEEPFSALANFRVLPVCGNGVATKPQREVVRLTEIAGQEPLDSSVFGRRYALSTKENSPVQGIRLGARAALREEVFHALTPREIPVAESIYPLANPRPAEDFATGQPLGVNTVTALAGGQVFKFASPASLATFNQQIAALDRKPDPHSGAAVLFLPSPDPSAPGTGFNLEQAAAQTEALASAWTETKKKVFVIRCDFSDQPNSTNPVIAAGTYGTLLNTTVSNAIRDFSYGKTWIEGSVSSAVIRLPQTAAYYATIVSGSSSRNSTLLSDAKAAYLAANPGFNFADYDIVGAWFVSIGMQSGGLNYAGLAGGSDLWIQGTSSSAVHVHEFGHNYGIGHSSYWVPPVASTNPVDPSGSTEEYGDPFDVMGDGPVPTGVFHAEAKQRLNWLAAGQWTDATAGGSGTYRIYRIDDPNTTGVRGLRVTRAADDYYWLSYRRLFTNDWLRAGANVVWKRAGQGRSWLIDTTPGSLAGSNDRTDGSILIGRTYADSTANVYLTPLARGGTGSSEYLDVRVNIGPFPGNTAPSVTIDGPTTLPARQTCIFTAQATDPNGDPLAYYWDFGQGFNFENNPSATFAWASGGTYTVRVTVSDMKGQTSQATKTVTVTDPLTTWNTRANSSTGHFNTLVASPTKVIAAGEDFTNFKGPVATSTDGVTWTATQLGNNQHVYGGIWDGAQFLLAGEDYDFSPAVNDWVGCVFTSPTANAGSWTRRIYAGATLRGIAYGGGVYVAVGDAGTIRRSLDGITWSAVTSGTTNNLSSVAYGGGKFVAVGFDPAGSGNGTVLTSVDGTTWVNTSAGAGLASWHDLRAIIWSGDRFVTCGWYSKLRYSLDLGATFLSTRSRTEDTPALAYGRGVYFAAGVDRDASNADIDLVSTDGMNWTALPTASVDDRNAAIFFNNTFITAGNNHSIRQSGVITQAANGYTTWRESYFPDHGSLTTYNADTEGDGLGNLLEYALGRSPLIASGLDGAAALPRSVVVSSNPQLSDRIALQFNLPEPAATDLTYIVEATDNLGTTWSPLATKVGAGNWVWNAGGATRVFLSTPTSGRIDVTVGDSQALNAGPRRFLRLRSVVNQ